MQPTQSIATPHIATQYIATFAIPHCISLHHYWHKDKKYFQMKHLGYLKGITCDYLQHEGVGFNKHQYHPKTSHTRIIELCCQWKKVPSNNAINAQQSEAQKGGTKWVHSLNSTRKCIWQLPTHSQLQLLIRYVASGKSKGYSTKTKLITSHDQHYILGPGAAHR